MITPGQFHQDNFQSICVALGQADKDLGRVLSLHGNPPLWTRPNTFATLVLTILEQQVSLAAAFAAYKKLQETVDAITPEQILGLSDEALRSCYFSRQKIGYVRGLAKALAAQEISLENLAQQSDDEVRQTLKKLKGIGDWTVDIYLIHALQRTDVFPLGDLALVNALKEVKRLSPTATKEEMLHVAEPWRPYRSIATMILWHHYIQKRNIKVLH